MIAARLRALSPLAILAIAWGVFAIHAYPGVMSAESFVLLREARAGEFSSVTSAVWSAIDWLIAGPFGLVAAQSLMFVAGAYSIAKRLLSPRRAAVVAAITLVFPPVLAGLASPGTTGLFAGGALLGAALLGDPRPRARAIGCLLLALAIAVRAWTIGGAATYDLDVPIGTLAVAAFAVLPIVVMLLGGHESPGAGSRRLQIAFAVWAAILAIAIGLRFVAVDRDPDEMRTQVVDTGQLRTHAPRGVAIRSAQPPGALLALEIPTGHARLQAATDHAIGALAETPLFSPWPYLVLALALLVRARDVPALAALAASAVTSLPDLALGSDNYAQAHWIIAVSVLVTGIVVAGAARPKD